jgi:hypothetical protein
VTRARGLHRSDYDVGQLQMDLLVTLTPGMRGIRIQYIYSRTWRIHRYKCKGLVQLLSHVKYLYFTVSGPERFNNFADFLVSALANGKIYSSQLSRGNKAYSFRYGTVYPKGN